MFITWNNLWCPCCGYRLRTKPRNLKKGKKQLSPSVAKVLKMMEAVEAVQAPEEPKTVVELNPDGTITPITATTTT